MHLYFINTKLETKIKTKKINQFIQNTISIKFYFVM